MKTTQKIRLVDVAELAGVSLSAAGKVLNGGSDSIRVGKDARKRILAAAGELNYQPNMAASILAGGQSKLIGVMVDSQARYRNRAVLVELEAEAARLGYRLIISWTHDNIDNMEETYQTLQKYGIAGVICLSHDYPGHENRIKKLFSGGSNVIFMEKPFLKNKWFVASRRTHAMHEMMKELVKSGRKKIALVHGRLESASETRLLEEYREALTQTGLDYAPELVVKTPGSVYDVVMRSDYIISNMISVQRPDAVYIDDAEQALCIQGKLQSMNWKLPDDLVIFGGNGDPLFQYSTPPIRSFDPQYRKIAVALLSGIMDYDPLRPPAVVESAYIE